MQIYKSTDEIEKISDDSEIFRVTDIKQALKNENRVNIFINGKYNFSLDISQLVDFKIKIGKILSSEELEEYKRASEFGKLYQRTLEWVLVRPRSEKEVKDYLVKKIYERKLDKDFVESIIERLKEKKYIDDKKFASYYVENRFVKKGISKRRLEMELMKKGVKLENASEILGERDEKEEILKIIRKKRDRYDDEKLIAYLVRQGFSFQLAHEMVLSFEKD